MAYTNYVNARYKIQARAAFKGNSLSAEQYVPGNGSPYGSGYLSGDDLVAFVLAQESIRYLVRSYRTPIAWETADGSVYLVTQRFSPTTSRHQGLASLGLQS